MDRRTFPCKSVSITGGTGTVAGQFIRALLAQFPQVGTITTTCRNPEGPRAERIPASSRVKVVEGSLDDLGVLTAVVDAGETVYHLAAWLANVDMPDMTEIYITNSLAAGVLAKLCARRHRRLVFTSSHSVYFAGDYRGRISEDGFAFRRDFTDWIDAVKGDYYRLMDAIIAGETGFAHAPRAIEAIHREQRPPFEPKIYDRDDYHIYCLTKLLAERFVLDHGGAVLRLANVYGPGDESVQAVAEACRRIMAADPAVLTTINQPFKKLVPAYLGDIIKCFITAATLEMPDQVAPVFTVASQEGYLREDALLRATSVALNDIRGTDYDYKIEQLPPEDEVAFTYDLGKMRTYLLPGEPPMPFEQGVREQLLWLMGRADCKPG